MNKVTSIVEGHCEECLSEDPYECSEEMTVRELGEKHRSAYAWDIECDCPCHAGETLTADVAELTDSQREMSETMARAMRAVYESMEAT